MQPVRETAAKQLAQRLRDLREDRWTDVRLTQKALGAALGGAEPLSVATISSYESQVQPKVPPPDRLAAYATFFATRRSVERWPPQLLDPAALDEEEREWRDREERELRALRAAALGEADEHGRGAVGRMWHFTDGAKVTLICGQLPNLDQIPYTSPSYPNYMELASYADLDALVELHGHIRAENPSSEVYFRTAPNAVADDLSGHVVLLGGVAMNYLVGRLIPALDLPVTQQAGDSRQPDVFVRRDDQHAYSPKFADQALIEDVGMLVRAPNPLNSSRTLTVCNGVHTRGVMGAVRSLTDAELRNANEQYLSSRFANSPTFGLLMRVLVFGGHALTPDFRLTENRLHEWPESSTR